MGEGTWIVEGHAEPINLETLRSLHRAGELAGKVVRPSDSDQPLTADELSSLLGTPQIQDMPSIPPVAGSVPPVMSAYPRASAPAPANEDPMRFVVPVNPSGWALAAGYLGLFSVLCLFAPFSLFAGIMGLRDIKANPNKTGIGRAWFGLIMGAVGTIGLVAIVVSSLVDKR